MEAAALLASPAASSEEIEAALAAVLRDGTQTEFAKAFGPRRLVKRLALGGLSDAAEALADELLAAATQGAGRGLTAEADFSEELHHEELHPDDLVTLSSPPPPPLPDATLDRWWLHLPIRQGSSRAALVPSSGCQLCFEPEEAAADGDDAPTLHLAQLSRRARLGSEIECKVWPAAAIMGRWLWRNRRLVHGQTVLELGAGVGTAGLAAAASGARRVVLTDINDAALRCARANCNLNGERVRAATAVAHLDWSRPPILEQEAEIAAEAAAAPAPAEVPACSTPAEAEVEAMLRKPFDLILAADVVNDVGLSEMVYRMIQLYLAPRGLFVMVCPKARHRHCVDQIRALLLDSAELSVSAHTVPEWLTAGLEEAQVVEHEMILAQWADGGVL